MKRKPAKPFLKWAGGKTQLLPDIARRLPQSVNNNCFSYYEPFVGSGAVLFRMLDRFKNLKNVVVNDVNEDLINTYTVIRDECAGLIEFLRAMQDGFYALGLDGVDRKNFYNDKRNIFNEKKAASVEQAALFIFLNRTCFNGLYRVNSSGEFNVPMGNYRKPLICDPENLKAVSEAIQKVVFLTGDYQQIFSYRGECNFFYFDPPYKPLSDSSNFNSYAKSVFDDHEQIRLKLFCDQLHAQGDSWMLSNSDVKGYDPRNNFFDDLYAGYHIERVFARRNINSKSDKRGKLTELLITNY